MVAMQHADFTSQEFFSDPAAAVAALRAAGAVIQTRFPIVGRVWITTTHDMASRVLKDSETFTLRRNGAVAGLRWWMPGVIRTVADNMLTMDEPDHTRLRGIVDEAFGRRAILGMEPHIFAIAERLAGELFGGGSPADLVALFAQAAAVGDLRIAWPAEEDRRASWHGSPASRACPAPSAFSD
jgi:cytochrome P450 PksS